MIPKHNKASLYRRVDNIRQKAGYSDLLQPISFTDLMTALEGYAVTYAPFKTQGLQGLIQMTPLEKHIFIRADLSESELNFYGIHEIVHGELHHEEGNSFQCFCKVRDNQNIFAEWQANEGSAQLLVPYQSFIPFFWDLYTQRNRNYGIVSELACYYGVTDVVVWNRISTLSYEIDQYANGIPVEHLTVLSKAKQDELGISPTLYNATLTCGFIKGGTSCLTQ